MSETVKALPIYTLESIPQNKLMPFLKETLADSMDLRYPKFDNLQSPTNEPVHLNTTQNTQEFTYMCKLKNNEDANITVSISNQTGEVSITTSKSHVGPNGKKIFTDTKECNKFADLAAFKERVDHTGILNPAAHDAYPNLHTALQSYKNHLERHDPSSIQLGGSGDPFHFAQLDMERIANAEKQRETNTNQEYFSRDVLKHERTQAGEVLMDVKNPDMHFAQMAITLTNAGIDLTKEPYRKEFESYKSSTRAAFEEAKQKTIEHDKAQIELGKEGVSEEYKNIIYPPVSAQTLSSLNKPSNKIMV